MKQKTKVLIKHDEDLKSIQLAIRDGSITSLSEILSLDELLTLAIGISDLVARVYVDSDPEIFQRADMASHKLAVLRSMSWSYTTGGELRPLAEQEAEDR